MIKQRLSGWIPVLLPFTLLGAFAVVALVRATQPSEPDSALRSGPPMTDGSSVDPVGSARSASLDAVFGVTTDIVDYTFVFPAQETAADPSRVVRLDAR